MSLNSLIESLRSVTLVSKQVIKEADENNSTYVGTADEPKDIKSVVADICHQWDALKLEANFPDNVKAKLDGAIGDINPGNAGDIKDTDEQLSKDQDTQATEMAGDVKAVKDEEKFIPKVSETKLVGKVNDQTKKAEGASKTNVKTDAKQIKKDLSGDKKTEKATVKVTTPVVGKSKVK